MTGDSAAKRTDTVVLLLLISMTIAVFFPVYSFEFLLYDDDAYITRNDHIRDGLTAEAALWALTAGYLGIWHPVTWASHAIDVGIFGYKPAGHHLMALAIHVLTTCLLFAALKRMTERGMESAFVAALFAVHPLHVESVAWVSERKDLLSALFFTLTLLAYTRYTERPRPLGYVGVCILFALGLMSKPMLVTLPCVLLLLDFWPLNRLSDRASIRKAIIEKIPLFAMAAVCSAITWSVQAASGAVKTLELFSLSDRVANALVSYCAYLWKTVWPSGLAVHYPHRAGTIGLLEASAAAAVLLLVTGVALARSRKQPYLIVGWLWFLGMLVPIIGLVQVGAQGMADRYTYLPLVGVSVAVVWSVSALVQHSPMRSRVAVLCGCALVSVAAFTAAKQTAHWRDTIALFTHDMRVVGANPIAHAQLGYALNAAGRLDDAIPHFEMVVEMQPGSGLAHHDLGAAYAQADRLAEAEAEFSEAAELTPDNAMSQFNLGDLRLRRGDWTGALEAAEEAVRLDPDYLDALVLLAGLNSQEGNVDEAEDAYRRAIAISDSGTALLINLGNLYARNGRLMEAEASYREALVDEPDNPVCLYNLANALHLLGRDDEARESAKRALELQPDFAAARNLMLILEQ